MLGTGRPLKTIAVIRINFQFQESFNEEKYLYNCFIEKTLEVIALSH